MVRTATPLGPRQGAPISSDLTEHSRITTAARYLCTLAAIIAAIGLIGWMIGMPALTGTVFGAQSMAPLSAAAVLLYATSLLLSPASRLATPLATLAFVATLTSAMRDLLRIVEGNVVTRAGESLSDALTALDPGWPAPNTAASLALIGLAILLRARSPNPPKWRRATLITCATVAVAIATLTLVGYAYGVPALQGIPGHRVMAVNAAVAALALALAVLIRSDGGRLGRLLSGSDAGAMLARVFLPTIVVVPFTLGVLRLVGDRAGWFDAPMGTALRTLAEMALFAGLVIVAARRLRQLDKDRDRLVTEERDARMESESAQTALEEQAQTLEEQTQELEATIDELRTANETLDVQRATAEDARQAEARAKSLLDAVIDQLPVGVVLARIPTGEIIRRNLVGEEILASFARSNNSADLRALAWSRSDGRQYSQSDFPLARVVRDAAVIDQEEMTAQLSDGKIAHLTVSAAPVYEGGKPVMAVAVFADLTSRRAAEDALAEREALLESFFRAHDIMISVVEADISPESLTSAEPNYRFLLTNAQAAAVFQKTPREVDGRSASELGIPAERRRSFMEALAETHRSGKPSTMERAGLPSTDGHVRMPTAFSIVVSPLGDIAGRLPRFCLIATDVSRQRNLEEELRQAQKLEAVGRLAGGIAHDFNNLLTAITGFTRFAIADLPAESSVRDDLDQAIRAAERAASLTHQLLAFSRQQVLQPQALNLNQVVATIEPMLRRIIGEDIAIHRSLAATLGTVRADRGQLEQVLVNLVVNARDAMPEGGLLTIETADVFLEQSQVDTTRGGKPGPHVMLAVTDTGVGMSRETRERIFEPFFTTKDTGRGTGLGLATVFGIVKQSGGSIWVYSEPGRGTTFKIYLPRYDGPSEVSRMPTPVPPTRATGRVLLVEDDRAVRTIAARILRRDGYEVVEASTGREAVDVFGKLEGKVDLILTDLVLPELGGRALIRALAERGAVPPVVFMSGYTAEAMSAQSILEPGDQFIEKPFTADALLARIREGIQGKFREPRRAG